MDHALKVLELTIKIVGLLFAIVAGFGLFQLKEWRKLGKRITAEADDLEEKNIKIEKMENEIELKLEKIDTMMSEVNKSLDVISAIRNKTEEELERKIEIESRLEKERPDSIKEKPSEKYKEDLSEYNKSVDVLENFGLPLSAEDYYNRANKYFYAEDYKEAIKSFTEAIKLKPDFAYAWNDIGAAYGCLNLNEEALNSYNESIRLDQKYILPWLNKVKALAALKRYEDALQVAEKTTQLEPNSAEVWSAMALIFFELGQYKRAIETSERQLNWTLLMLKLLPTRGAH